MRAIVLAALLSSAHALLPTTPKGLCRAGRAATIVRPVIATTPNRHTSADATSRAAVVRRSAVEDGEADDDGIDPDIRERLGQNSFDKLREEAQNPFR